MIYFAKGNCNETLSEYDLREVLFSSLEKLGIKDKVIHWLKFYYEKEWRKESKQNLLKQIN